MALVSASIALVPSTQASGSSGVMTRVSVDSSGNQGRGGDASRPVVTSDGRFVAFRSEASNLVPDDTNGQGDFFVHDRQGGATTRVSVGSAGAQANGAGILADISADGRFVAFDGTATNLVPDDTNAFSDVFVHDRQTRETTRVSVDSAGGQADRASRGPSLSADGRWVAFESFATNLTAEDTNATWDIFVHDRETGQTTRVSVDSAGDQADSYSIEPSISADGRVVAFTSDATDLVSPETNVSPDIFVHDRETGQTSIVSLDSSGGQANGSSSMPDVSADGEAVAFTSGATNLVPDDTNRGPDVFVHHRRTGATTRVSNGNSGIAPPATISGDGKTVAFSSSASNLVEGDTSSAADVFVHHLETKATTRVSVAGDGAEANGFSSQPSISGDGSVVAFQSRASNLVPGDTNLLLDVFVHDRATIPSPITTSTTSTTSTTMSTTTSTTASTTTTTTTTTTVPPPMNAPDLAVTFVLPPAEGVTTASFNVSDVVENIGNGPAGASVTRYYLSPDQNFGFRDPLLEGGRDVPPLDPGRNSAASQTVTVTHWTPAGNYYVISCVESRGTFAEGNKANNCGASAEKIRVDVPGFGPANAQPDLAARSVLLPGGRPTPPQAAGGSFSVTDEVTNYGDREAPPSVVTYHLSKDDVRSRDDLVLEGQRPLPPLTTGEVSKGSQQVSVPISTPEGTYLLLACADGLGHVRERTETNNCSKAGLKVKSVVRPLPQPAPVPTGSLDNAAVELARAVNTPGSGQMSALLRALQLSGVPVLHPDQPLEGSGLAFEPWELELLIAVTNGAAPRGDLAALGTGFEGGIPELEGAPVADLLLAGLRSGAESPDASARFWARFVAALGNQRFDPVDLLDPGVSPEEVQLDTLQANLILSRLGSDLVHPVTPLRAEDSTAVQGTAEPAVAEPPVSGQAQAGTSAPCTLGEVEKRIVDTAAATYAAGFVELLDYLADNSKLVEHYANRIKWAQAFLDLARLFSTAGFLEGSIELVDAAPPLIRTHSASQDGNMQRLRLTVRNGIEVPEYFNCLKLAFAAKGLELDAGNDAPKGNPVEWKGGEGFRLGPGGERPYVGWFGTPFTKTNDNGEADLVVTGLKQQSQIPESAPPVEKQATIRACVALKGKDLFEDFVDIITGADPLSAAIGILERTCWVSFHRGLDVRDWDPRPHVHGRILIENTGATSQRNGAITRKWTRSESLTLSLTLVYDEATGQLTDDGNSAYDYRGTLTEEIIAPPRAVSGTCAVRYVQSGQKFGSYRPVADIHQGSEAITMSLSIPAVSVQPSIQTSGNPGCARPSEIMFLRQLTDCPGSRRETDVDGKLAITQGERAFQFDCSVRRGKDTWLVSGTLTTSPGAR